MNTPKWYSTNAGNDYQGLVADETTGETIAVTYKKENACLIASAPDLLEALKEAEARLPERTLSDIRVLNLVRQAIAKAEGR